MFKRIGSLLFLYLILSIIAGFIFFVYDTLFGSARWEWPAIFLAMGIPFLIIHYNITGLIISIVFLKQKLYIVIAYILFALNLIFSMAQTDNIYNIVKNYEFLKKLNNYDMASLNHNSIFIFANIISIIFMLVLLLSIKIYENRTDIMERLFNQHTPP